MASVLFTALALIAAGQAGPVASATAETHLRSPTAGQASAPAGDPAAGRGTPRRRG